MSYSELDNFSNSTLVLSDSTNTEFSSGIEIIPTSISKIQKIDDKPKPHFYKVEVLSTEIKDVYFYGNTKVTKMTKTIKSIEKPTLDELVSLNQKYFDYLKSEFGEKGDILVQNKIDQLNKTVTNIPEITTIDVVKIGKNSILHNEFTFDAPFGNVQDPVNFIFRNNGGANNVETVLKNNAIHDWNDAIGEEQFVFIDNIAHGGSAGWVPDTKQLEEGNPLTTRYHVRIFDGGFDPHHEFVEWSIGSAHLEHWNLFTFSHDLDADAWEAGESEVRNDLDGQTNVGFIEFVDLSNSGCCQGIPHDGMATMMELTREFCFVPTLVDWEVTSSCTLASSEVAPSNVIVSNNARLTIADGTTLTIDFANNHLLIKGGSSVLIKSGGTIKSP